MSEKEKPKKKQNITLLFITLMVTMLLASLSQMVLSSALPTIVGELHGVEHMTWVVTAYMLASTIMMPVYGKFSDLWGRKPLLLVAIVLFVIGSVVGFFAPTMSWLIISRVIQGLGGGGLILLSQTAVADVIPARQRGKYLGIMGGVFAFSSVAGPLLGGWLTEGPGWRWAFLMNIPLGIIALVAVIALMHLPKPVHAKRPKVDYMGMVLLTIATSSIILTATWGGSTYDWNSAQIIGMIISAIVSSVLFVFNELRAKEPIIPMHLFKDNNFVVATIAAVLTSVAMFGVAGYMPTYFQMVVGASATGAGLLMTPMMIALLAVSITTGWIVSKTGKYKIMPIIGSGVLAIGLGLMATTTVDTPIYLIGISIGVVGAGLGAIMQILTLVVQNSFPHKDVGTATAANNYFRQVGASLGSAIVGSIFTVHLTTLLMEKFPQGFGTGGGLSSLSPSVLGSLPENVQLLIAESYNGALIPIFAYLVPLALLSGIVLFFVKEKALTEEVEHEITAESLAEGQIVVNE